MALIACLAACLTVLCVLCASLPCVLCAPQVFKLILPHFRYTLPINAAARGALINANGELCMCVFWGWG
jgi:hypothetical protein